MLSCVIFAARLSRLSADAGVEPHSFDVFKENASGLMRKFNHDMKEIPTEFEITASASTVGYGLVGYPLGHSFSASFFSEKFRTEGIDARYDNYEMPTVDGLRRLVEENANLRGLNVTIPHKQAVIPLLDTLSAEAQAIGAVNVIRICREEGTAPMLEGHNTDVVGFVRSLQPLLCNHHQRALVLGTGGASRAILHGLRGLDINPTCVSRTARPGVLAYADLTPEVMAENTVIVNCSPVGMSPHTDECPDIPYHLLTEHHLLYDLVYNPLETRFLALGRERGAVVKNGLEMLHLQALAAWDIWQE